MPKQRNGLKKPADLGRVERLKGLHSRSIRRGRSQFLKKGSAVIFSRNISFETPAEVADWLVMLAGGIHENDTVLEPSAGRGALIKAIHRACPSVTVECYELMPENREFCIRWKM